MADEEEKDVLATVKAAVEQQKMPAMEPGPQITEEQEVEEPHDEGPSKGDTEAKETQDEGDGLPKDEPKEPEETVQDATKVDISRPPKRLPLRTKQRWLSIDPGIREDIVSREAEFESRFKQYDGLGKFRMKAEQAGTTLQTALESYDQMETAIRTNPVQGVAMTLKACGIDPTHFFNHIVQLVTGGQQQVNGQAPPPMQASQGLSREEMQAEFERQFQAREMQSQIAAFEADPSHHYLEPFTTVEEMGPIRKTMLAFLHGGIANTLQEAYDMSIRANGLNPVAQPNGNAANTGQAEKAAVVNRSKQAAKAIVGAPSQPSSARSQPPDIGNQSMLDTVRAAVAKQKAG